MNIFHTDIQNRWHEFTRNEQMANIGAEVGRAIKWRSKNRELSKNAFYRALELVDFTVNDNKNKDCLGEILRMRELLVDYFMGENIYKSTDASWEKYFLYFNLLANRNR